MEGRPGSVGQKILRWPLAIILVAAVVLHAQRLSAQQPAPAPAYSLLTTPQLTGAWLGARSSLAESGVTFLSDSTNFYFGNTAGGLIRDFDFAGHNDYVMFVDGAKRWGMEGFSVKIKAEHRYGETLDNDIGAFFSPTILADLPKVGSERLYLTNVLFTQALSEDFAVFAGKLDTLDGDMNAFAHGRGKNQFSNLAFVFNPIVAATVPYSTLGAGFVVLREGESVLGFTVLNPTDTTGTSGFEQLFNDGLLLSAYLRLPTQFFALPGHQLFGATWNNQLYNSIGDAYIDYPNLVIPQTRGSWSLFWNFDQYLVYDEATKRGWGTFGRAGIADDNTNPLGWFLSFGIGGNSPIESRPADRFGVGWYYASTSSQIGPILEAAFGQIGNGQGIECFYNYQLTPAIYLTPDLQVIIPAREAIDAALVVGLRAQFVF
jgi:porin